MSTTAPEIVTGPEVGGAPALVGAAVRRGVADGAGVEEVLARIEALPVWVDWSPERRHQTLRVAGRILVWLQTRPGTGWAQRWENAGVEDSRPWDEVLRGLGVEATARRIGRKPVKQGLMGLLLVGAVLPGYEFLAALRPASHWYGEVRTVLAPATFARLAGRGTGVGVTAPTRDRGLLAPGKIVLPTGLDPAEFTVAEFDELHAAANRLSARTPDGAVPAWDLLRGLGIPAGLNYREHRRTGQQSTAELVDGYGLRPGRVRDVLVRYLDERRPGLDFKSFRNVVGHLAGAFWADIEAHHPEIETLTLPDEVTTAWKQRLRYTRRAGVPARPRRDYLQHLMQVRAFYLDIAEWAQQDPSWAEHAVACPIRRAETQGVAKQRHRTIAAVHQRIR